ncbi:hypothetical protein BN889_06322 [Pseudomonas aeruginosa PA38182]|nr:hypothetical protein BN889_06322 [Pseudomonas aeruginosa PA38182]
MIGLPVVRVARGVLMKPQPAAVEARVTEAVVEEPAAAAEVVDLPWEEPAPSLAAEPEPRARARQVGHLLAHILELVLGQAAGFLAMGAILQPQ